MTHTLHQSLQQPFRIASGNSGKLYSLPALEKAGLGKVSRLPVSIRIVLESVLRNCDGKKVTEEHVRQLADWKPNAPRTEEIPFVVARIVLQDFTGVPLLVRPRGDARASPQRMGKNPKMIEPLVPVDLVVDHSVQVDYFGTPERARPQHGDRVPAQPRALPVPEVGHAGVRHLQGRAARHRHRAPGEPRVPRARACIEKDGVYYPDTLVGTDSHTTMINGLGVVGWGVGGIEAEAGMLGQPVYFLTPDVVGVHLTGRLARGRHRDRPRAHRHRDAAQGEGGRQVRRVLRRGRGVAAGRRPRDHRQHGARVRRDDGLLPGRRRDRRLPRRDRPHRRRRSTPSRPTSRRRGCSACRQPGEIDYSQTLELDLATVVPSVAGPKRPQDRIELPQLKRSFHTLFSSRRRERLRQAGRRARQALSDQALQRRRAAGERRGPAAPPCRGPARRRRDGEQPADADRVADPGRQADRDRPRRRADRGHHLLHQHLQPERDARRRPAGEEGGRARASRSSRT